MTESSKTPESRPTPKMDAATPAPAAVLTHPPAKQDKASSKEQPPEPPKTRCKFTLGVNGTYWLVFVVLMLAGGFGTYMLADKVQNRRQADLEQRIQAARQEILQASSAQVQAQIQTQTQTLNNQIQTLQTQLAAEQASKQQLQAAQQALIEQVDGLARALQLLSANGGEAALLHAVEQLVDVAQQQLTLAGNVGQAIIALETAQARLARASFPTLVPLQQAVNGDLERLRALPARDVAQLAAKLDELQQLLMHAPLLSGDWAGDRSAATQAQAEAPPDAAPNAATPPALADASAENITPSQPWWTAAWAATRNGAHQAWQLVRHDLHQLVSIRRIDDPNALLMAAEQATQLREHLRMRAMMARLSLMTAQTNDSNNTQTRLWQTEMQAIRNVIQARFDLHTRAALQALNLADQLAQTSVALDLPHTLNSQQAIQTLTETLQTRAAQQDAAESLPADEAAVEETESGTDDPTAHAPQASNEAVETESRPQVTT